VGVTKAFINLEYWVSMTITIPFQALIGIRTYALFHGSRFVKWIIAILFTVQLLAAIAMGVVYVKKSTFAMLPFSNVPCSFEFIHYPIAPVVTMYAVNGAYDAVLCGMLVFKAYQAFTAGKPRLIGVIFRLGMLYFTLIASLYILCVILYITTPQASVSIPTIASHLLQVMQSVLSARFILKLHSYLSDLTIQSMTVSPEQVLRMEDGMEFGGDSTIDDETFETSSS